MAGQNKWPTARIVAIGPIRNPPNSDSLPLQSFLEGMRELSCSCFRHCLFPRRIPSDKTRLVTVPDGSSSKADRRSLLFFPLQPSCFCRSNDTRPIQAFRDEGLHRLRGFGEEIAPLTTKIGRASECRAGMPTRAPQIVLQQHRRHHELRLRVRSTRRAAATYSFGTEATMTARAPLLLVAAVLALSVSAAMGQSPAPSATAPELEQRVGEPEGLVRAFQTQLATQPLETQSGQAMPAASSMQPSADGSTPAAESVSGWFSEATTAAPGSRLAVWRAPGPSTSNT